MPLIFRWSIWGNKKSLIDMLPVSIGTFRRAFGSRARYVVGTDEPSEVRALLRTAADVIPFGDYPGTPFDIDSVATWRKWCPTPRLDLGSTEFYVDADVFLVGDPTEFRRFDAELSSRLYLAMPEPPGSPYYIGAFARRVLRGLPPVNTGLLGQRAGTDFTAELLAELRWWTESVSADRRSRFDEQGAVSAILSRRHLIGQVELLPQDRYRVVNRFINADLVTLRGIAAIHATAGHAAYTRFRSEIVAWAEEVPPPGSSQADQSPGTAYERPVNYSSTGETSR